MPRPDFIQAPTLAQSVSVYQLIRFGRKIVSQGNTFTPEDAVEFRALMNRTATLFELPGDNDNDTRGQAAVSAIFTSDDIGASA
jgi:hypothetical protein